MEKRKKLLMYAAISAMAVVLTMTFFCVFPDVAAKASAKDVLDVIIKVLKYVSIIVGVIMLLSGIMKFVVAKQNDNGPDEHKAAATMAVGIVLIILFTVIIDESMVKKIAGWITDK